MDAEVAIPATSPQISLAISIVGLVGMALILTSRDHLPAIICLTRMEPYEGSETGRGNQEGGGEPEG